LWRGVRRRCPRCGESVIFERWVELKQACPNCQLSFEKSPGDTWGFWVILDRIFIFVPIVVLYFGFAPADLGARLVVFCVLVIALVGTMPHRQGVAVALDYLARTKQGEA
jgi:uncharacterized protein (DUF983 family)